MKTKIQLKMYLADQVVCKKELTQARRAIKRVPFKERTPEAHREMMSLWWHASTAKEVLRIAQLAYAFVRGRPYWTQERHTLHPAAILAPAIAAAADANVDDVRAWLEAPVSTEERAAFNEHLEESKRSALEARRARSAQRSVA